jgi:DNA-binding transcriptional regulator YhcF (GntR family)
MAPKTVRKPKSANEHASRAQPANNVSTPAAAQLSFLNLFSFLKETRGMTSWTLRDLAKSLKISPAAAKHALAILEMQGYVKPTGSAEWITTPAGEIVSGSKLPRYSRETVERSLESFADHLQRVNEDASAEYKIAEAVAFGDFLSGRARVQAADVGIRLEPRNPGAHDVKSAAEQSRQEAFLKQLRGRTPLVNLHPFAPWMSARTHRNLHR